MLLRNKQCADAGTENCPCRLAEYGKCIVCSRLNGSETCNCDWQGTCIYNEYLQNNRCINGQRASALYKTEKVTWYEKDLVVMRLAVPRGFAEAAALPGSFVFVRDPSDEHFYNMPVSVMRACHEEGFVELAVKITGPKTQSMVRSLNGGKGQLEMRGVYRNGLLGVEKLTEHVSGGKRVLCIAKGLGIAPLVNYARWAEGRDRIDFIIDTEKITDPFVDYCMEGCCIRSVKYDRLPLDMTWELQDKYDVIVLSASDFYQQNIYIPDSKKILSNNHLMCCGEGICGACIFVDKSGQTHRMCKCAKML